MIWRNDHWTCWTASSLAHAESADPMEFFELDFRNALQDACDEVWGAAQAHRASLTEFSPPASTVSIACEQTGDQTRISIAAEGCGVSEGMKPRLFKRFSHDSR